MAKFLKYLAIISFLVFVNTSLVSAHYLDMGEHVASDLHVHAFSHNAPNEIYDLPKIYNENKYDRRLSHINRRSREGGFYGCIFHSFTEHFGYFRVNKPKMKKDIAELKKTIKAKAESGYLESECSAFSMGLEYTPEIHGKHAQKTIGHTLMWFADDTAIMRNGISHLDVYKEVLSEYKKSSSKAMKPMKDSNADALFGIPHPQVIGLKNLGDVSLFLEESQALELKETPQTIKERFVAIEFDRRFRANGSSPGCKSDESDCFGVSRRINKIFKSRENLYKGMLSLGYRLMPLVNGDRHAIHSIRDRKSDPEQNLTVLGPQKALSKGELSKIFRTTKKFFGYKKTSLLKSLFRQDPVLETVGGKPLRAASSGYTNLVVHAEPGEVNFYPDEKRLYKAFLDRSAYVTYKKNLELYSEPMMGSVVDFSELDSVDLYIRDYDDVKQIGEPPKPVPMHSIDERYRVVAVLGKDPSKSKQDQEKLGETRLGDLTEMIEAKHISYEHGLPRYHFDLSKKKPFKFLYFKLAAKTEQKDLLIFKKHPIAISAAIIDKN